jgi:hypothetical protein
MTDYEKGRADLIDEIKYKVAELEETATIENLMFDVLFLLKTLK